MRPINRIVVHCAATPPDMNIGADTIRKWHLDRGWSDIGYHGVIRRNGMYEPGRPESQMGAHARGANVDSLAVCLVGGITEGGAPENNFTPEQFDTLQAVLNWWTAAYNIGWDKVLGHCDLPGVPKACPSFDVQGWIKERGLADG